MQGETGGDPPERPDDASIDDDAPLVIERGERYTLSVGDDTYDIWDAEDPDGPIASFSGDETGMDSALREFNSLEGTRRGLGALLLGALPIVFGAAVATWIVASAIVSIEYAKENTASEFATSFGPPHWVQWVGTASSIALNVSIGSLFVLAFTWLHGHVAPRR